MNRHKKIDGPARRSAFIDGIVSDGRKLGVPTHRSYQPNKKAETVGLGISSKASDGFHPMRQSPGGLGGSSAEAQEEALLDEPIVLDDIPDSSSKKRAKKGKGAGKPRRWRKILKRTVIGLMSLLILAGAYFGIKIYLTERHIFKGGGGAPALAKKVDISQLKGEGDGRINILLLGIGGPNHDGGDLTDTILLASIDPVNNTTALLSIPRDLWVKIPGNGYQKINAAYAYGKQQSTSKKTQGQMQDGLNLLDKTLSPILGIPIHYHAIIDFSAFKQAVDTVGGVDVNAPEELYDPTIAWENAYNPVIAAKGMQHMNGAKALLYSKSRETSSDFARGERQRLVLVALKEKILTLGTFSNPVKVSGLLSSLGSNVYTDFTLSDISRLYEIIGQIPSSQIASLDMVTPPHNLLTTGNINGLSVVEPRAGLFEYDAIQNYVRNALRDGFLAKENAQVAVYNATTTPGLATKQGAVLKSYGYNVTVVDNANSSINPAQTKIIDVSKGVNKYTRNYLQQRYGVVAGSKVPSEYGITPPAGTAFVIILGQDVANSGG
jgi:polyisoprenyl-teichoic acid--peptidoglycan teichoic acid transferase